MKKTPTNAFPKSTTMISQIILGLLVCSIHDFPALAVQQIEADSQATVVGELKQWHTVTVDVTGPSAKETDKSPNPFLDYRMQVEFQNETGEKFLVPGYFAADGKAANSSATSGNLWRAHLTPNATGKWTYKVSFVKGKHVAIESSADSQAVKGADGLSGEFNIVKSDKSGRDLRGQGRLQYVGKRYLQFAGSKKYFLKAGADSPETLLAYKDFDGTIARKRNVPLKSFNPHLQDFVEGDPTWRNGRGKGLIGAVNYLSSKGCNAFSFLTYNAGGDGDNVWPFIARDQKLHYDCSKLDQWGIVFTHGQSSGMFLHFKLQETENDDNRSNGKKVVPECFDNGTLGVQRKLYCREMVARFGHHLALNWNLGEENTQDTKQQKLMAKYIRDLDPYDNHIVVHSYPDQHEKVYGPLLGNKSVLTGASLQNSNIRKSHEDALKWINRSKQSKKPWVVAFDESGTAAHGQCPDLGYKGFDGTDKSNKIPLTEHDVRKYTLWGTLMAGGMGVEYYFGYQFPENDLLCEDWRSRDRSWNSCRIALAFFEENQIPFWEMENSDPLVFFNSKTQKKFPNQAYSLSKSGDTYLVYLSNGVKPGKPHLKVEEGIEKSTTYSIQWFNPRKGGSFKMGSVEGGIVENDSISLGNPPAENQKDWLAIIKFSPQK